MSDPDEQDGFFPLMASLGILPEGVNPKDQRVIAICERIRTDAQNPWL